MSHLKHPSHICIPDFSPEVSLLCKASTCYVWYLKMAPPSSRRRPKPLPGLQGRSHYLKPAHPRGAPLTPPHSLQLHTSAWDSPSNHCPPGEWQNHCKVTSLKVSSLQCPEGSQIHPPVCPSFAHTPICYCHKDRIASKLTSWLRVTWTSVS